MTDTADMMETRKSLQDLSPADFALLLRLLDAFTTGLKVMRALIVVVCALGLVALAVQRIIMVDQTYRGYQK